MKNPSQNDSFFTSSGISIGFKNISPFNVVSFWFGGMFILGRGWVIIVFEWRYIWFSIGSNELFIVDVVFDVVVNDGLFNSCWDGSEKTVTLQPVKGIDDGLGNINWDVYETDEEAGDPNDPNVPKGKGLKKGCFQFALNDGEDREIKRVYMNIEYKGSTSTNYAGAYSGSGKGTLANIYDPEEDK